MGESPAEVIERLTSLRQHQHLGKRSPHKPLLVLLALNQLATTGSSALPWSAAEHRLADLIADFGPPSRTGRTQSAAYPFTRLRSDGIWQLDADVPMDQVRPLADHDVVGRLDPQVEAALVRPEVLRAAAREVVESEFPPTLVPDVLAAAGFDPDEVLGVRTHKHQPRRNRDAAWPARVLAAWDLQCAFCSFDGLLGGRPVGVEAAHVRWFNFGGPDELDNGLALCSLHHKLFDRGVLGLTREFRVKVSASFTARTDAGRRVYELADRELRPRRGTPLPDDRHVEWHDREVFKEPALAA